MKIYSFFNIINLCSAGTVRSYFIGFMLALNLFALSPVAAAEQFYVGNWKFESAIIAPWADPSPPIDRNEKNRLIGKTVSITPKAITGPQPFACAKPRYKIVAYSADLLFQGAFEEMKSRDRSIDPLKLAHSIGFSGTSWQTLETGCEFDWHFVDPATIEIGLNDYIYTLKRQ